MSPVGVKHPAWKRDRAVHLYVNRQMSSYDVSRWLHVSHVHVLRWVRQAGHVPRTRKEGRRLQIELGVGGRA